MQARHFTRAALPGILMGMSQQNPPRGAMEMRQTPNPNARKFVLAGVRFAGSRNYALGSAVDDPLAARLLMLDGVYNVFLAQHFVTVNKVPQVEWPALQRAVEEILADYLTHHATHHAG